MIEKIKILTIWFINIFLNILRLKKRDENLWIFGSWNGESYIDNSKYFFEYVINYHSNINAIWITKNIEVKNKLNGENKKCYLYNEKKGYKVRLNAKYTFFTNGINDFGTFDLSQGSIKVALWHGMPLKKLLFATNNLKKRTKNIIRFLQYMYLKIYSSSQRNITIATSKITKSFLIECFELNESSVLITGQPRNDVLFENNISKIHKELKHGSDEKFILYMPTWRAFGKEESFLDDIIISLSDDSVFLKNLEKQEVKLYIKPHPRIKINSKSNGNIIILKNNNQIDTQQLIASADSLITDYSSVFIDYALLKRPIYFYTPDLEDYKKNGNDLFLSFEEFSKFIYKEISDFKRVVLSNMNMINEGTENTDKINKIFNCMDIKEGRYSETLYKTILEGKK